MKFVLFGYDFMLPVARRLIADGHELAGVFSFPCDNVQTFNEGTVALAREYDVPCFMSAPEDTHLEAFISQGVEAFVSTGYPTKIPQIAEDKAYALNVHPAFLPKGRGIIPLPYILMGAHEVAGITVHKMTQRFDAGDILYQERLDIGSEETLETMTARIVLRLPDILSNVMADLHTLWAKAQPQDDSKSTHFPVPTDETRTLDWGQGVEACARMGRAFGRFGVLAILQGQAYVVYDFDVWKEPHTVPAGEVVAQIGTDVIVAASDGFVCLKRFEAG